MSTPLPATCILFSLFLLLGTGCSSSQPTTPANVSANSPAVASGSPAVAKPAATPAPPTHTHGGQGGQIIETDKYHLELLTVNAADSIHLDFFLQTGAAHTAVANAKVTAHVTRPDGSKTTLPMQYDASGQHYYADLPGTATGEYQVVILSDIQGEKVNARYRFKR